MFTEGQQVRVIDSECTLHNQVVTIVRPNPRCTAEWEVRDETGNPWLVHSCRLRLAASQESFAEEVRAVMQTVKALQAELRTLGVKANDCGWYSTAEDLITCRDLLVDAVDYLDHRTSLPLG